MRIRGEINGKVQILPAEHSEYQRKNGNAGKAGIRNGAGGIKCGNRTFGTAESTQKRVRSTVCGSLKMDSIVATQTIRVEKAKENVEAARERMAEAMKERKMHETLREKAFEAFLQEENHAESKAIDELTSYTYGQKTRQA